MERNQRERERARGWLSEIEYPVSSGPVSRRSLRAFNRTLLERAAILRFAGRPASMLAYAEIPFTGYECGLAARPRLRFFNRSAPPAATLHSDPLGIAGYLLMFEGVVSGAPRYGIINTVSTWLTLGQRALAGRGNIEPPRR